MEPSELLGAVLAFLDIKVHNQMTFARRYSVEGYYIQAHDANTRAKSFKEIKEFIDGLMEGGNNGISADAAGHNQET